MTDSDMALAFLKMFFLLPLVAALAYLFIKYVLARSAARPGGTRKKSMLLLERLPLGPKSWLDMVQVGDRYYLLGHNEGAFNLLEEFDHLPTIPEQGNGSPGQTPGMHFRDFLRKQADKRKRQV